MIKKYDKLVRDNIIKIIEADNKKANYHIASNKEYELYLLEKLDEEIDEFTESKNMEELADVCEVLEALANIYHINIDDMLRIKETKASNNGKFNLKYILENVED